MPSSASGRGMREVCQIASSKRTASARRRAPSSLRETLLLAETDISGMVCGRLFRLMPLLRCFRPALALVAIGLLNVLPMMAQQPDRAGFAKVAQPFIKEHCVACHGSEKQKG